MMDPGLDVSLINTEGFIALIVSCCALVAIKKVLYVVLIEACNLIAICTYC